MDFRITIDINRVCPVDYPQSPDFSHFRSCMRKIGRASCRERV